MPHAHLLYLLCFFFFFSLIVPHIFLVSLALLLLPLNQKALIAVAPGVRNKYSRFGTPVVVSGLVLASAGTVVFPAILALLSDQVCTGFHLWDSEARLVAMRLSPVCP